MYKVKKTAAVQKFYKEMIDSNIDRTIRSKLSLRKKIFFGLITFVLMSVIIELASFVLLEMLDLRSMSYGYPKGMYIYDDKIDYKYKPYFKGFFSSTTYSSIPIVINSLGFRDYEFDIAKGMNIYRVLLLGDSITFGAGVRIEDTYAKQAELKAREKCGGNFELINAGVNSYHFEHYYIFTREYLEKFQPDHLIIGLCINDVRPKEVVAERYLVQPARGAFSYASFKHHIKKLIKKSPTFQLVKYLVFSNSYMRQRYSSIWITEVMFSWNDTNLVDKFQQRLTEIKKITDKNNIRLSVIIFPELHQLLDYEKYGSPREKLLTILDEFKVDYIDLYNTFRDKKNYSSYYLPGDTVHFTAEGHRLIAEKLSDYISCR